MSTMPLVGSKRSRRQWHPRYLELGCHVCATTQYSCYVTDLLYQVIDAANNTTTLTYDLWGARCRWHPYM